MLLQATATWSDDDLFLSQIDEENARYQSTLRRLDQERSEEHTRHSSRILDIRCQWIPGYPRSPPAKERLSRRLRRATRQRVKVWGATDPQSGTSNSIKLLS